MIVQFAYMYRLRAINENIIQLKNHITNAHHRAVGHNSGPHAPRLDLRKKMGKHFFRE